MATAVPSVIWQRPAYRQQAFAPTISQRRQQLQRRLITRHEIQHVCGTTRAAAPAHMCSCIGSFDFAAGACSQKGHGHGLCVRCTVLYHEANNAVTSVLRGRMPLHFNPLVQTGFNAAITCPGRARHDKAINSSGELLLNS